MNSELKELKEFIRKNTRYNRYMKDRWLNLSIDGLDALNKLIDKLDKGDKQ